MISIIPLFGVTQKSMGSHSLRELFLAIADSGLLLWDLTALKSIVKSLHMEKLLEEKIQTRLKLYRLCI